MSRQLQESPFRYSFTNPFSLLVNMFLFFDALQTCMRNSLEDSLVLRLSHEPEADLGLEYLPGKSMVVWQFIYLQEGIARLRFCYRFVPKITCS